MQPEIITLVDSSSGQSAKILVSQGFNCYRWTREESGKTVDVLWSTADIETGDGRASSSGIPILFPYPGRLRGMQWEWQGKTYPQESGDALGNAIHGFLHTRPWRLVEHLPQQATAEFQASVDDPTLLPRWPSDFLVRATYRLQDSHLKFQFQVTNPGDTPLPFGLGLHPYFRTGIFGVPGDQDRLQVPLSTNWPLQDMLPTGESEPERLGLAAGMAIGDQQLDHVFGHELGGREPSVAKLQGAEGRGLTVSYGPEYPYCVIYTPPHREAVCIEPYTCLPNSSEFLDSLSTTGWRELAPGETFKTEVDYHWQ